MRILTFAVLCTWVGGVEATNPTEWNLPLLPGRSSKYIVGHQSSIEQLSFIPCSSTRFIEFDLARNFDKYPVLIV